MFHFLKLKTPRNIMQQERNKGYFATVKSNILSLWALNPIDIDAYQINFVHFMLLAIINTLLIFLAYLVRLVCSLQLVKLAVNIVLPTFVFFGCIFSIILSFIGGRVYGVFLDEHKLSHYYLVLLSTGYLPFVMIITIFFNDIAQVFSICAGITADYFLRKSVLIHKTFESGVDKFYFVTISMLMNIGAYWFLYPLFFIN